jgi:hypothetical protein
MKITQIISETTAGCVATVAMPMGETQKRPKVSGLEPADKVMFGKSKKKGPYGNSLTEGAMKQLSMDLKELKDEEFKKKYKMTKQEARKELSVKPEPIKEAELSEDDIILVPGQGRKMRTGFVPHGKSRVDHEVEMARSDLFSAAQNAQKVYSMIKHTSEEEGLEGWVQEKIIKANDYLNTIREYLEGKQVQGMAEDMTRRGFLRGLGAAAAGAAGIGAAGNAQGKVTFDKDGNPIKPPDWKNFQGTTPAQGAKPLPAASTASSTGSASASSQTASAGSSPSAASRAAANQASAAAEKIRYTNPKFNQEYERIEKFYQQTKSSILNNKRYSPNPDIAKRQHAEFVKMLIAADTEFAQKTNALMKEYSRLKEHGVAEGAKVDRMVKHITKSEKKLGKSKDEAENIAWATANKRGMLDNKNKKA